jgi:uncharacterized membrane protein
MDLLIVVALIILLIVLLNIQSALRNNASINKKDLSTLYHELQDIKNELAFLRTNRVTVTEKPKEQSQEQQQEAEHKAQEEYKQKLVVIEEMRRLREEKKQLQEEALQQQKLAAAIETDIPTNTIEEKQNDPVPLKESWQERWLRNNPDLEKFIGENLVNKIGIAILVLAIGFFVKYAIDKDWIGSIGRVGIGIACGGILVALAHKLRNTYKAFSSVLAGGGIAVFYFTITLAFHQFQLFTQPVAFIIMIVITVFAVILSLVYNKQELAIIALLGGFVAPFLVSNGNNNYQVLFTYLIILNTGLLVIAYNKAWRILNILSFIFTIIIFAGWFILLPTDEPANTWRNAFAFATAFYLLFFIINIAHNIKEKKHFIASDFGILLITTCLYFSVGIVCLNRMNLQDAKGIFSAAMGVFNLAASYFLFRRQKVDTNILYLLIGITLTFISITAPLQLHGNYITLFWASETVLLYWLYTKSHLTIIQHSSFIVWIAMLISLIMDWGQLYTGYYVPLAIIINKAFITTVYTALATWFLFVLRKNDGSVTKNEIYPGKITLCISALLLLFTAGALEINYQFHFYFPDTYVYVLYLLLYTMVFIVSIVWLSSATNKIGLQWRGVGFLLSACIVFYLLCIPSSFLVQYKILVEGNNSIHFWAHWITALLALIVIYKLVQLIRENRSSLRQSFGGITWAICILTVIFFSVELQLLANKIFYSSSNPLAEIQRVYIKTALPILWGLCSFAFMWQGMRYKFRPLRIISLSVFAVTLVKLFTFDISDIPVGGKIAAFFCLGVLLLVVSFMYQRLKKIIIEDEEKMA